MRKSVVNLKSSARELWFNEGISVILFLLLLILSILFRRIPNYSWEEMQIVFVLYVLLVSLKSLELTGVLPWFLHLALGGRNFGFRSVILSFFLGAFLTNDLALLLLLPFLFSVQKRDKKEGLLLINLICIQYIAVNVGSFLLPIGNPQNLFLFWRHTLSLPVFLSTTFPLVLFYIFFLFIISVVFLSRYECAGNHIKPIALPKVWGQIFISLVMVLIALLCSLKILPLIFGFVPLVYSIVKDRSYKFVDYGLIFSFVFLFGVSDILQEVFPLKEVILENVFGKAVLWSQLLGNVPVAVIFTDHGAPWRPLLWGVNVGGFGWVTASFASIIVLRMIWKYQRKVKNMVYFFLWNCLALAWGALTYVFLHPN